VDRRSEKTYPLRVHFLNSVQGTLRHEMKPVTQTLDICCAICDDGLFKLAYREEATGWTTGVPFPAESMRELSLPRSDRLWGSTKLLSNGY
jgi:hypothetical protein